MRAPTLGPSPSIRARYLLVAFAAGGVAGFFGGVSHTEAQIDRVVDERINFHLVEFVCPQAALTLVGADVDGDILKETRP